MDDGRGTKPADPDEVLHHRRARDYQPDSIGVLTRPVDNRPFLRCLHGLALCAWRQRHWDDAAAMFEARVWLDPAGSLDAHRLPRPGPCATAMDTPLTLPKVEL